MNTKDIGDTAEARVLFELKSMGYAVLTPFGDNQAYDLVIESDGKFTKVQVKSATVSNSCVQFNTDRISQRVDNSGTQYSSDEIDCFIAYCSQTDSCYYLSVEDAPKSKANLRLSAKRETSRIRWADEYLLSDNEP